MASISNTPTESALRGAIEALDGYTFQLLADSYLHRAVDGFSLLTPYGRTDRSTTTKSPDSYAYVDGAGKFHFVEATNRESVSHVSGEISKYLDRARAFGVERIARFCVVLGKAAVTVEDVADWNGAFRDEGIDLLVITPEQLRFGLRDPKCAALWRYPLRLRYRPAPFDVLADANFLAPNENDVRPTLTELSAGSNDPSPTALVVETLLNERGCAIVRSHGATGKSVLAGHLAVRHEQRSGTAYYLDLASPVRDPGRDETALDAMTDFADDQVLFIVDNIHLDETLAYRLTQHWQTFPNGSRLLLLGQARASSPLFQLRAPEDVVGADSVVELTVRDDDLRAIYTRLASRVAGPGKAPRLPWGGRRIPRSWKKFEGDLVVFSLALWARMGTILETGDLEIDPKHAREFVRARYFGGDRQNDALRRVAALSALELRTPETLVDERALEHLIGHGVVEQTSDHQKRLFSLTHPRFAELILAADNRPEIDWETLAILVDEWPPILWPIARRMDARSKGRDVSTLAAVAWRRCMAGDAVLPATLGYKLGALQRLITLGVATEEEVDGVLAANYVQLLASIAAARPPDIRFFLEFATAHLRATHAMLVGAFTQADGLEALTPAIDRGSLLEFDELLRLLEGEPATRLAAAGLVDAVRARAPQYWAKAFESTSFADLTTLFELGHPQFRVMVAQAIQSREAAEALRTSLAVQEAAPRELTELLIAAERASTASSELDAVPKVVSSYGAAAAAFRAAGDVAEVVFESIKQSLLDELDVRPTVPEIRELASEKQGRRLIRLVMSRALPAQRIGEALAAADLPTLEALLVSIEQQSLQAKLARAIPFEKWVEARTADPPWPGNWRKVGYILAEAGRDDLDEFMARQLLNQRSPAAWERPGSFPSLVRVLVVSRASREEALALVEPVATDRFVARAYIVGRSMECARTFLAAWGHLHEDVWQRLGGDHLVSRSVRDAIAGGRSSRDVASTIAMTGAASLISEDLATPDFRPEAVRDVLQRAISESSRDRLRYHHIVIWNGARALAGRSEAVAQALVKVPIAKALESWEQAEAPTPRLNALRISMIEWLRARMA